MNQQPPASDLQGKLCIITGSTGALGAALCRTFASNGCKVVGISRGSTGSDSEFAHYSADLSEPSCIKTVFQKIEDDQGPAAILIHNAGLNRPALAAISTPADWDAVQNLNLRAAQICIQQVVRQMIPQRHGLILNISSLAALHPLPGQSAYAASKGGLESLTRCLAVELAGKNIRVNAVAPGFLDSPMLHSMDKSTQERLLKKIPLTRWGTTEEIADCAVFLVSDRASYITGQIFHIDGGLGI